MNSTRPNLRQIADSLGLSVTTVSRALKDGPEVHPRTIERVKAVAEAAGYVPNMHGLALRTGRTHAISAVLPLEAKAYLSDIARLPLIEGMTVAAQERGYTLSITSTLPEEDPLVAVKRVVQLRASDGVIITRMTEGDRRIPWLQQNRVPFVTFGRSADGESHPYVDVDNAHIAREATEYLLGQGHQRIALQTLSRNDVSSQDRRAGYMAALKSAGLPHDEDLVGYEDFSMATSQHSFVRMLDLPAPPTALISANEIGLLGALAALRDRGLVPGQDVTIVARDNTGICDFLSLPVLTHSVDMQIVGQKLVTALIACIENQDAAPVQSVLLPSALKGV
jgi:LacI family transcriptional regulator